MKYTFFGFLQGIECILIAYYGGTAAYSDQNHHYTQILKLKNQKM